MKIGFVIPSRLKSTRLPKKILLDFNGQSALAWAIDRARASRFIDEVVVATTPLPGDAEISRVCLEKGVRYFQGDPDDVLKRFRDTARYFDFDFVVNITPDNTLFSVYLIDLMVSYIKDHPTAEYLNFQGAMLGTGIYALKREALEVICDFKSVMDTEIWGPLFHKDYFEVHSLELPGFAQANYRLTLDTPEDYLFIKKLYQGMDIRAGYLPDLADIISFLDANPSIAAINAGVKQASLDPQVIQGIEHRFKENKDLFDSLRLKYQSQRRF